MLNIIFLLYLSCTYIINIHPGDAHYIFMSTCQVIMGYGAVFIRWPERNEYHSITKEFRLPYTIGKYFSRKHMNVVNSSNNNCYFSWFHSRRAGRQSNTNNALTHWKTLLLILVGKVIEQ